MLTVRISRGAAFLMVLGVFLAIPAGSWASHRFSDVPDSNIFHADIGWLADAGVTLGCNPPANDQFCPDKAVTRAQMSAFMRRFAQYLDAEDGTPGFADSAGDADTLGGQHSSDFLDRRKHVWSARVTAAGSKNGTGPYTVSKFSTGLGHYGVTFDVESVGFSENEWFTTVASPICAGYSARVSHGGGLSTSGGKIVSVTPNIWTYDASGNRADCGFSLLLTFDDPNPRVIIVAP